MLLTKVENSSNVLEWGYDPISQELQIRFKQGALYTYPGVPQEIADGIAGAESKGSYIAKNVVKQYKGTKVPPPPPAESETPAVVT